MLTEPTIKMPETGEQTESKPKPSLPTQNQMPQSSGQTNKETVQSRGLNEQNEPQSRGRNPINLKISDLPRLYSFFAHVDSVMLVSNTSKPPTITATFDDGKTAVNVGKNNVLVIVFEEPLIDDSGVFPIQSPNLDLPTQDKVSGQSNAEQKVGKTEEKNVANGESNGLPLHNEV